MNQIKPSTKDIFEIILLLFPKTFSHDDIFKGRDPLKKNVFFWALPEFPKPPPPITPIRATWPSFFGSQNSRFESQFRTKTTIYTIQYTVYMQPKKQLKVQYIGIFEEIDSFY